MEKIETIEHEERKQENRNEYVLAQQMSEDEYRRTESALKRKLDIRLMGMVFLIYTLNFLDRNNIAAAKVAGLEQSLDITSGQFSTAVSLAFVGYVLMQVPSNMFLAHLKPSLYLPACMFAWATVSACTGAVQSAGGLYAARFMLGLVEAAFFPGALFLISSWYKRSEMSFRCSLLYSGALLGSAFSGLIAAGITSGLDGACGLAGWRWIFIIEGSITASIALIAVVILPDWPSNTRWLKPEERAVAQLRLMRDAAGQADEDDQSWSMGFKAAFEDWRTYIFALMFFCVMVTTSAQNFFPSIVATLGFGRIETLALTAPPYIFGMIVSILNNLSADRYRNASFHILWPMLVAMAGFIISAATLDKGARYFAMFLLITGGHGANAVMLAWSQKTLLRPRMKRAAAVAFVNACGNTAQIWTPYLYPNSDSPRYITAMSVNAGFAVGAILLAMCMRSILRRANKLLEDEHPTSEVPAAGEGTGTAEAPESFRYIT